MENYFEEYYNESFRDQNSKTITYDLSYDDSNQSHEFKII